MSSVAVDGKDGKGLKLEQKWSIYSSSETVLQKSLKNYDGLLSLLKFISCLRLKADLI